jgi:hypothetical protein
MCRWRSTQGGAYPGRQPVGHVASRGGVAPEVPEGLADLLLRQPGVAVVHRSIVTHCMAPRASGTVARVSK